MEMTDNKKEIPLVKKSTSYKIVIPAKVERLIRFLCERVWDTEWSGVLFYNPTGAFEDGSLEIHCVDILPMDIGSATYTEFDMSPDVISYMAQNPELLDCKMGLIHSHNNMSTFFSGTDTATLREEGNDRNHFVSLIVNNAGKYTAAITRKVKFKSVRELSYESFGGTVNLPDKEVIEGEEIEYFNLDIVFEEETTDVFAEVASRLKEIKEAKAKAAPKWSPNTAGTSMPGKPYEYKPWGGYSPDKYEKKEEVKQPTLFDDLDWDTPAYKSPINTTTNIYKRPTESDEVTTIVTNEMIEGIVNQLITGSVTVTKLDADSKKKLVNSITQRFEKRFGKGEVGAQLFTYWATDFVEFLLWYSVNDPDADECEVATQIANKTIAALKKLPKSDFIDEYINLFLSYADRI